MRRLNLSFFTELGRSIGMLSELPPDIESEMFPARFRNAIFRARQAIEALLADDVGLDIPASIPDAQTLLDILKSIPDDNDGLRRSAFNAYWPASRLETMLDGELSVQSTYHIMPKRAYDTKLLISKATNLFSEEIRAWFYEHERYDILEAGKCLAFEIPTAAGFHLIRALESVIRRYYAAVVGVVPRGKTRNWGTYITNLGKCGANAKVLHALEQMRELHRNPIMHPDDRLTVDQALDLVGMTISVVAAIHTDLKERSKDYGRLDFTGFSAQPQLPGIAAAPSSLAAFATITEGRT